MSIKIQTQKAVLRFNAWELLCLEHALEKLAKEDRNVERTSLNALLIKIRNA